jgi:hypothetical protein
MLVLHPSPSPPPPLSTLSLSRKYHDDKIGRPFCYNISVFYFSAEENHVFFFFFIVFLKWTSTLFRGKLIGIVPKRFESY